MKIELLPSDAEKTAIDILDGKIPAQVNSMEVVEYLVAIAQERGISLSFYRTDYFYTPKGAKVSQYLTKEEAIANPSAKTQLTEFDMEESIIAVERDLDMRPV